MDTEQFQLLYEAHYRAVKHYALTLTKDFYLAEDLTHEAFMRYSNKQHLFRKECSEYTMLCQIVKNLWLNHLRRERKLQLTQPENLENCRDFIKDNPECVIMNEQENLELHQILHTLPEPYKEVFTLHVFGELTFKKIAVLFSKSESWAKMTYYRAKSKIILEMEEKYGSK